MQPCLVHGSWTVVKPMTCEDVPATHLHKLPQRVATEETYREIFRVIQWGLYSTNAFFRLLYNGKIWLTKEEGLQAASLWLGNASAPLAGFVLLKPPRKHMVHVPVSAMTCI